MKYPFNLKVMYIGTDNLPVNTVDSTHYINDDNDFAVLVNFINIFSEYSWVDSELFDAINLSLDSFLTKTKQDNNLHLVVI